MGYEPESVVVGSVTLAPGQVVDVTDRAGRFLGHVVVDSAGVLDVTGSTVAVSSLPDVEASDTRTHDLLNELVFAQMIQEDSF